MSGKECGCGCCNEEEKCEVIQTDAEIVHEYMTTISADIPDEVADAMARLEACERAIIATRDYRIHSAECNSKVAEAVALYPEN